VLFLESLNKTLYCYYSTEFPGGNLDQQIFFVSVEDIVNPFLYHNAIMKESVSTNKEAEADADTETLSKSDVDAIEKNIMCFWLSKNIILSSHDSYQRKCHYINLDFLKYIFSNNILTSISVLLSIVSIEDFYYFVYELFIKVLYYVPKGFYTMCQNVTKNISDDPFTNVHDTTTNQYNYR